ncbi:MULTISPECIES: TniB family NTP-binding protein [unclassified Caballeronia]|uniref:TniB family NTP-binding protein n=1 Tax=unclassified Caballeronia TaxID=2646786 RepID=UPI0020289532|nr:MULTISPECIES: TniB family NTP-binding protein [unclassified Caballeronia]
MKNDPLGHLLPAIRPQAQLDNASRIQSLLRDRWIDYPRATQALDTLERLLATPRRERMPCLVLHGDSNIGKTQIIAKFRRQHPDEFDDRLGVNCALSFQCRCRRHPTNIASTQHCCSNWALRITLQQASPSLSGWRGTC